MSTADTPNTTPTFAEVALAEIDRQIDEKVALQEENERLRAALRKIATGRGDDMNPTNRLESTPLDFPRLGINTQALFDQVERLLEQARAHKDELGAVNWGDLGIADVEYRISVLTPEEGPWCVVVIEEADPDCRLPAWLYGRLDKTRFPNVRFECEW
jgi:uncharacterized small protein (DUF1192 family)